ncbi:5'-methylthioadenosine/adenosylhomocysteine nucleosidase [Brackiella oedipodis]|uniref:5'-methylthioadenosine/adenosylhomocysteine nucleosidase n=1 Tax=Brackiella oedipodis TaxID=124225 RepID=UPI000571C0F9|nr:5'-methylthioadenosine/adenosylhomocysteine nucleosidase [Brackiella oedipodis]
MKPYQRLGIMAALPQELAMLLSLIENNLEKQTIAKRDYYTGQIHGVDCVIVLARVGKVAAAASTATMINVFKIDALVFTGTAGALNAQLGIGDVVIATSLSQHDMDASPFFPRYEIPLLGLSQFQSNQTLSQALDQAAHTYIEQHMARDLDAGSLSAYCQHQPKVWHGQILSGDRFIQQGQSFDRVHAAWPEALCVEMEGAAVAQVCYEYGLPFAVLRVISDLADGQAHIDFDGFLNSVAKFMGAGILQQFLQHQVQVPNTTTVGD